MAKVLQEHRTDYNVSQHATRGAVRGAAAPTNAGCILQARKRQAKYETRGFKVERVTGEDSRCPYCQWIGSEYRPERMIHGTPRWQCPINGLALVELGYEVGYPSRLALRWLEQQWIASDCTLTRDELIALATPVPPHCPLSKVNTAGMSGCEATTAVYRAQELWYGSGCAMSAKEILAVVWAEAEKATAEADAKAAAAKDGSAEEAPVVVDAATREMAAELEAALELGDAQVGTCTIC